MLILALDTTSRGGSAAVVRDGEMVAELSGDPSLTHGQRLPTDLMRTLELAGARVTDVDLFAVAVGPGSFTGLRVGIATMQGLAFAAGRLIVPVSSLDALARTASVSTRPLVASWMDAQRGEVFAALYDATGRLLTPPSAASADATLDAWAPLLAGNEVTFAGDGAVRYLETITVRLGSDAAVLQPTPLLAGAIGQIAAEQPGRGVVPHAVVPIYIRKPDAELARARRLRTT